MFLTKKLEQLGLTEKEAKIYVALLEMGEATAQELAAKSGINRATTYVILKGLIKRGLATSLIKRKKTYFLIENPLQILDFLELEKKTVEDKIICAKKLLAELEMMEKLTQERTKIKFFEGREGVILIQKDIARSGAKAIDNVFNINISLKHFPASPRDHRQILYRRKIKIRSIIIYDPKEPIPDLPISWQEQTRYLPGNKFPFFSDIVFYSNKVAMISLKDNFMGVIIENKAIADGLKLLFELAWQGTEKYKIDLKDYKNPK